MDWEKERIFRSRGRSESENPLSAYISRLCSPSVGLRDWGRRGEREIQSAGHRNSEGWHARPRTHAHTHTSSTSIKSHLYLFFCCVPPLLPNFHTSLLTHSTVLCFIFPFKFMCFIHPVRLTRVAYEMCCCLSANKQHIWRLKLNTEHSGCVFLFLSGVKMVVVVVENDWVTGWQVRSLTGSLPAGRVEHSRARRLEVTLRASSSTSCHLHFHTLRLGTAADRVPPGENCLPEQ